MNFFQSQDIARKNTRKLIVLFAMAVIALILLTNLFLAAIFFYLEGSVVIMQPLSQRFNLGVFLIVGAVVTAVILLSSLYKIIKLSAGGSKFMAYLDADIIVYRSGNVNKQKILNVVEEMAIASGTPVPQVYLLNEPGINAFAAGLTVNDAAIGITRGAIERLNRDELQGVIAHEFSHILNGDMSLNLRLMGILHGIMVVGLIGEFFMGSFSQRSKGLDKNSNFVLGLGLIGIGYAGTFFGNWIKAAVSRQREYLADASAVQFTRNPDGIAGALMKIGGYSSGSKLENPHGAEISHSLFCEGVNVYFKSIMATHPPLATRIKRILPHWDGSFISPDLVSEIEQNKTKLDTSSAAFVTASSLIGEAIVDLIGNPDNAQLDQATQLIQGLPEALYQSAHEPHGAIAVIYFLLLDTDKNSRAKQLEYCRVHADIGVFAELRKFINQINSIDIQYRLTLIDIALPALRQLSTKQEKLFVKIFVALVKMDSKISLFEWALQKIILVNLNNYKRKLKFKNYTSLKRLTNECSLVLSLLVYTDVDNKYSVKDVFEEVKKNINLDIKLLDKKDLNLRQFNAAIEKLSQLRPLIKPQFLKACAVAICADNKITPRQLELFRAISDILDCPMPPLSIKS